MLYFLLCIDFDKSLYNIVHRCRNGDCDKYCFCTGDSSSQCWWFHPNGMNQDLSDDTGQWSVAPWTLRSNVEVMNSMCEIFLEISKNFEGEGGGRGVPKVYSRKDPHVSSCPEQTYEIIIPCWIYQTARCLKYRLIVTMEGDKRIFKYDALFFEESSTP